MELPQRFPGVCVCKYYISIYFYCGTSLYHAKRMRKSQVIINLDYLCPSKNSLVKTKSLEKKGEIEIAL